MDILTVDYRSPDAAKLFAKSLHETGFAVMKNHPIPYELVQKAFEIWAGFFASAHKTDFMFDATKAGAQDGYFPFKSENAKGYDKKNLMEFFHYYRWGKLPPEVTKETVELFNQMEKLGTEILGWLEAGLPEGIRSQLSMPLQDMAKGSDISLFRIIHYPPIADDEEPDAMRSAPHEDIDLLTILPAASAPGLQARDLEGNWHSINCDPGQLAFNAGDMLQMCTKGYYPSTTHQVINPEDEDARKPRFSMPFFFHPHDYVRLSEDYTAFDYLEERLNELGLKKAV
ncbi:Isopenicillin N synthase family oxygenase [Candidatus Bealeia paramacronuclearis]|uniref:2-oxoglutarate-dependent ethylene/succinate-forming enzyme n=1 Tax=Candidatus Bealeia paramacronuclearis TaxID=1921001 RepID=A0ABZ2C529_9PROT|nr:Isopenicillin N synthase family oxygenase [Candidatus Bealeia paramacronuclearis]